MRRLILLMVLTFTALAAAGGSAHAATCTFTGVAAASWGDLNNWSCGAVPTSTDTAIVGSGKNVTVDAAAAAGTLSATDGQISFTGGAELTVSGTATVSGTLSTTLTGPGTLRITGASAIAFSKPVTSTGTLNIRDGAVLQLDATGRIDGGDVCLSDTGSGNDPALRVNKVLTIGTGAKQALFPCSAGLDGPAIQIAAAGGLTRATSGQSDITTPLTTAGTLTVGPGRTFQMLSAWQQTGGTTSVAAGGTLSGAGALTLSGGALAVDGTAAVPVTLNGGVLAGSGQVTGAVTNNTGTIRPGGAGAAGRLTIAGGLTQGAGATLEIDVVNGAYDVLALTGSAVLAGKLMVTPLVGGEPPITANYVFLESAAFTGYFDTQEYPTLTPPKQFTLYPAFTPAGLRLLLEPPVTVTSDTPPTVGTPGGGLVGTPMTCTAGTWSPAGKYTLSYAWVRDGTVIPGASGASYTITVADASHDVACREIATATGGSATRDSLPAALPGFAPVSDVAPVATVGALVGDGATCTTGSWLASPAPSFRIRWLREGREIPDAEGDTYTIVAADIGSEIACIVYATNGAGQGTAVSNAVMIHPIAPVNTQVPKLSGTPKLGATLTCDSAQWTGTPPPSTTIQWLRAGQPIDEATNPDYTLAFDDGDKAIACKVTATNPGGTAEATSASVKASKNVEQRFAALSAAKRATGFGLPAAKACLAKRSTLKVRVGAPSGITLKANTKPSVKANGKKLKLKKTGSRYTASVRIASLRKAKRLKVSVSMRTSHSRTLASSLTYKVCG